MADDESRIVLGGGCFWCLEAVYRQVRGVTRVRSGYAGGATPDPTYDQVCSGATGHAEVVEVCFDPAAVSLQQLLEIFWVIHDPTTPDRQGADVGTQYRSVILYADAEQRAVAEKSMAGAAAGFSDPIVTEIVPLERFWPAEDYHDDYYRTHPGQPYCQVVIDPKLAKFRKTFADLLRG